MRIVQLANFHAPTSGGLRIAVDTLRAGYLDAGHDCVLVAPGRLDAVDADDTTVRRLRAPKLPNRTGYRVILRRRAVLDLLDVLAPDVVEVHDKLLQQWAWPWARARGVAVVAMSHERLGASVPMLLPFAPDGVVRSATQAVARRVLAHCDALVVCSRFAAAEFGAEQVGAGKVAVVPLGVDLAGFGAAEPPPSDHIRMISVGRLSAEKRPDLALDALRHLVADGVPASLDLIGAGPLRADLGRAAAGLPVTFHGFLPCRASVAAMIGAADVSLAPGPVETFGLAALEALACGTPVVVVEGSGPAEFVTGHPLAGRATAADPAALATGISDLMRSPATDRRGAARARAEAYPWSATVDRMLAVHAGVRADADARAITGRAG